MTKLGSENCPAPTLVHQSEIPKSSSNNINAMDCLSYPCIPLVLAKMGFPQFDFGNRNCHLPNTTSPQQSNAHPDSSFQGSPSYRTLPYHMPSTYYDSHSINSYQPPFPYEGLSFQASEGPLNARHGNIYNVYPHPFYQATGFPVFPAIGSQYVDISNQPSYSASLVVNSADLKQQLRYLYLEMAAAASRKRSPGVSECCWEYSCHPL
ncbi:hypothetical protein AA313_de0203356 [Arthrobotrys entomopaga]|nr:hypothetical protein AA313_de0203356 [Arthrobotrys entomopaga]